MPQMKPMLWLNLYLYLLFLFLLMMILLNYLFSIYKIMNITDFSVNKVNYKWLW